MFRTRLISGIVLVLVALATIITGDILLAVTLSAVSVIAYRELAKACGVSGKEEKVSGPELISIVLVVLYDCLLFFLLRTPDKGQALNGVYLLIMSVVVLGLISHLFVYVFTFPKYKSNQIMESVFCFLYAPLMLSFIYQIREGFQYGKYLVWLVFLCSWGSDTCAYVVGVLFGRHKMTPKLSPKKSIEGAVGGVAGAALLCVAYTHFVFNRYTPVVLPLFLAALLGAAGALVSMVGDLAASAIKRDHDMKDYGKLIPGHGGIMDRFDSVIVAAPLIFVGLAVMERLGEFGL